MVIGALEAGGTKMVCALGDENGNIFVQKSFPTTTPDETMEKLISFYKEEQGKWGKIRALGIGCFGPIELDVKSPMYGHITSTPKEAWRDFDIVGEFKKAFNVPVGFDTDVNGSALGEYTYGIGKGIENLVYITIGTGVGIGIISGGKLLHGKMHPEGGHIMLTKAPEDSYEGKCPYHKTCMEGLAAGPAIEARYGKSAKLLADDPKVWELEAKYIAQAIYTYTLVLSPEKIILGGGVMHQEQLFPLIRKEFDKLNSGYIVNDAVKDLDNYIVCQSLNDKQGILGAIELGRRAKVLAK